MKIVITNNDKCLKQVRYFNENKIAILRPNESMTLEGCNEDHINYYNNLKVRRFSVIVSQEERKLEDLLDEDIKEILSNLGIVTKVRSRWKLIEIVNDNIPEGKSFTDYLK